MTTNLFSRFSLPAKLIAPAHAAFFGAVALLLGISVLAGWLLGIPILTTMRPTWPTMVLNAAICFILAGSALALQSLPRFAALAWLRAALGTIVFLIAAVVTLEIALDTSWIDFNSLQKTAYPNFKNPGQMAPNTAFGFMLVGLLLMLADRIGSLLVMRLVQILTVIVFAVGAIGVLSYVISLEFLYSWAGLKSMALHTACGFLALAFGIWCLWHEAPWNLERQDGMEVRRIYRTSDLMLTMIVVVVGLTGFAISQDRSEKLMADEISETASTQRTLFDTVLTSRMGIVELMSTRPNLIAIVREVRHDLGSSGTSPRLDISATSYLPHGFSAFAYTTEQGRILGSGGRFVERPAISIPIAGKSGAELLWQDGYILRYRLEMRDAEGSVGYLLTEQPLPELTKMHAAATRKGKSGDMAVCSLQGDNQLCFPFRWRQQPSVIPATLDDKRFPVARASRGETATVVTLDFRRQRVMAAFGPIGSTGLGLAVKMDMWELYEPIRAQFLRSLPFLALLVAGSVWLMRRQLRPLVEALDNSRQELAFMARHDALTGLPNRSLFHDRLVQAMIRTQRTNDLMALMYLDIDQFKNINDTFGHLAGDEVLRWVSQRLREAVRASDTVARLGGDEFTIILENLAGAADAERIAQEILTAIATSRPPLPDQRIVSLSVSIGATFYIGAAPDIDPDALLQRADAALYQSKQAGKNTFRII